MSINDGGPVYPVAEASQNMSTEDRTVHSYISGGLTLRDFFAAHALIGWRDTAGTYDEDARCAYRMADAMIAARKEAP